MAEVKTVTGHKVEVETRIEREDFDNGRSRLTIRVLVAGQDCGSVTVMSVNSADVDDFLKGELTLSDLQARFGRRR